MSAQYPMKEFQSVLVAGTTKAINLTGFYGSQSKLVITAPSSRTQPIFFIFRSSGSDEPTTCASGAEVVDGTLSPSMKPGLPVEVPIPSGTASIALKSPQAGDVYVTIYEVVS